MKDASNPNPKRRSGVDDESGVDHGASKFRTRCAEHAKASYKCLEKNAENPKNCQAMFDAYKDCTAAERKEIIDDRRKRFT